MASIEWIFSALLLVATISQSKSLSRELVRNLLAPKDPLIDRVRNMDEAKKSKDGRSVILDFIGLVKRHGYSAEEHYVTTEDGYRLVIHRIPSSPLTEKKNRKRNKKKKRVAFLQHGIISSSDSWVLNGAGKDLAFLLADQGYDVWLGNFRGNSYCRTHERLSSENADFWQYSYHEIGVNDLSAMIDYVLRYTREQALFYIGHSMGTTALFVLLSTRAEYNVKITLGVCLAPIAFWNVLPPVLKSVAGKVSRIKNFFDTYEIYDLLALSSTSVTAGRTLCADTAITQVLCVTLLFLLSGSDPLQINTTMLPEVFSYYPAGTSVQTIMHYAENIITNRFQTYDYQFFDDYKKEAAAASVDYELANITAPLALIYGANDVLASRSNVMELYNRLPNVVLLRQIPFRLFTHLDFVWAIDAKTLLYDYLMETMNNYDAECRCFDKTMRLDGEMVDTRFT